MRTERVGQHVPQRTKLVGIALILSGVVVLSGCSNANDEVPELDVAAILSDTSEFQAPLLEDGVVTPAEYEQALLAQRECVTKAGATPGDLYSIGNNETTFDWDITASSETEMNKIAESADACGLDYASDVRKVWAHQQLLSDADREELLPAVTACLQDAGVSVSESDGIDGIAEKVNQSILDDPDLGVKIQPCIEANPAFFSVPAPAEGEGHDHDEDE